MSTARALVLAHGCAIAIASSAPASAPERLADIPVTRATVFKDGTAMLTHRGRVACDDRGLATLADIPAPILGAFWTTATDAGRAVRAVRSGFAAPTQPRPAATFTELLGANIGREATLFLRDGAQISGTILHLPAPPIGPATPSTPAYSHAYSRPVAGDPAPAPVPVPTTVIVRSDASTRAVEIASIASLSLPPDANLAAQVNADDPALTIDFGPSAADTEVGVEIMYVLRGIRWIPGYRAVMRPDGRLAVELQASVINDAADLRDAPVEFIVGVPSFFFSDAVDPISMRNAPPILSNFFARLAVSVVSNMIASQSRFPADDGGGGPDPAPLESRGEDQFIYTVPSLSLDKGERAVVPLKAFTLEARDVYRLHAPAFPPRDVIDSARDPRFDEAIRALRAPSVEHVLVFTNTSDAPITTAPVLVIADGRPVAQSVTQYTPVGASGEFHLSTAVDITVSSTTQELGREHNALRIDGSEFLRVDLSGTLTVTNRTAEAVTLQVKRDLLGAVASASDSPKSTRLSGFDDADAFTPANLRWWDWYASPAWFTRHNPLTRLEWDITLQPGEARTLDYAWSYYWN